MKIVNHNSLGRMISGGIIASGDRDRQIASVIVRLVLGVETRVLRLPLGLSQQVIDLLQAPVSLEVLGIHFQRRLKVLLGSLQEFPARVLASGPALLESFLEEGLSEPVSKSIIS